MNLWIEVAFSGSGSNKRKLCFLIYHTTSMGSREKGIRKRERWETEGGRATHNAL